MGSPDLDVTCRSDGQGRSSYKGQSNTQGRNAQDGRAAHVGGALIANMHSSGLLRLHQRDRLCIVLVHDLLCNPRRVPMHYYGAPDCNVMVDAGNRIGNRCYCVLKLTVKLELKIDAEPIFCMFKLLREVAAALPWIPASGCKPRPANPCVCSPTRQSWTTQSGREPHTPSSLPGHGVRCQQSQQPRRHR